MRPGTRLRLVGSTWSSAAPPRRKLSQSLAAWFGRAGSFLPTGSASLGGGAAALSVARNVLAIPSQSQQQQQQPPLQKQGLLRLDRVRFTLALGLTVLLAAALAMAWDVVQRQPRRPPAARRPRRVGGADPAAAAYGLDGAGANGHEQPPSAQAGVRAGGTMGSGEGAQAVEGGGGSDNERRGGGASSGGGGIVDDGAAEAKSSALEEAVFAHAAWRYSPRLPAGYLFGWPVLAGAGCRGLPDATTGQPGSNISGPGTVPSGGKDSSQTPLPAAASATGCGSTATTSPGARRAGGVLSRMGVRAAAAAAEHVLAATEEGLLLTFAVPAGTDRDDSSSSSNHTTRYGQLGRGGRPDRPGVVWELAEEAVVAVAAGRWHSVAVTESGRVYTWGRNHRGQLGRWPGTQRGAMRPGRVLGVLAQQHVVAVSAGPYFTLAVTDMGAVYTWGLNWLMADAPWTAEEEEEDVEMVTQAEASNASSEHVAAAAASAAARLAAEPRRVGGVLEGKEVVEVDCGVVHWVGRLKNGSVFTCSTGFSAHGTKPTDEGYFAAQAPFLGRKVTTAAEAKAPRLLPIQAISVAASANTTFAVAHNFSLLSWGVSSPILGRRDPGPLPAAVELPREKEKDERSAGSADHVLQVAVSESFALARWRSGRVFSWGSNESGQLGRRGGLAGVPAPVEGFKHIKAVDIAAGPAQALAICHANSIPGDYAIEKQEEVDRLRFVHGPGSAAVVMDERPGSAAVSAPGAAPGQHPAVNESSRPVRRGWRYRKPRTRGGGGGGVEGDGQVYPVIVNEHHRRDIEDASRDILPHFAGGGPSGLYRGPCWNDGALGDRFVCGPYFMLVGAARSGCNDLFHRLVAGDVGVVAPLQPATEWWDSSSSEDPGRDFGWYLHNLSPAADAVSSGRNDVVTGEVAPLYLTSSGISVRGKTAQHFLLPELIHAFFPRLKIIVMLRNPIDRWISDFQTIYPAADLPGQAHYHASRWAGCLQEKKGPSADFACAHYKSLLPKDLVRSLYAYFLVDWLRIFPQDQVLVLRYEDYKADMQSTLQRVMQFLGLGVATEEQMQLMLAQPDHDAEDRTVGSIAVDDSIRGFLRKFFKHHNELLVNFTGDVRFLWDSK